MNILKTSQTLSISDSPSALRLEVLRIPVGNASFRELKDGIRTLDYAVDEIKIPRPCSAYDCTGESFTSGFDLLSRTIEWGDLCEQRTGKEQYYILAIFTHHICVDV